jgi:hypothetical protein
MKKNRGYESFLGVNARLPAKTDFSSHSVSRLKYEKILKVPKADSYFTF